MKYVELHARSAFSFLEGASLPEELAAVCAQRELPAMALLDSDGVYGAPRFHMAAEKARIKAHIGAEISISGKQDKSEPAFTDFSKTERAIRYPLLVES